MSVKVMESVIRIEGVMSDSVKRSVDNVRKQLGSVDKKTIETAAKMAALAAAATAAAGAMAVALIKKGSEITRTMNSIAAQTGATGAELAEFGQIARDIYASGKGENMQEIADALINIRQASGLAGEELKAAANSAMLLKDTFGMETAETTRAATALMKNFGVSAEEAYGIIAVGAQNGANKNGDLLDTLNEYSVHYKALGLDADQFVQSLIAGAEAGSFSIDKVGDAVKEFTIRAKDGSKTSAEGFATIGLNASKMTAEFAAGGERAQKAFFKTVNALNAMEDPVKRNAAGVALFGTMFEDLEAGVLDTFSSMEGASIDAEAALKRIEAVKYNDVGYAISQIGRSFEVSLMPAAEKAGQMIFAQMPQIKASIAQVTPVIAEMGESFAAMLPAIIDGFGTAFRAVSAFVSVIVDNWGIIKPILLTVGGFFAGAKIIAAAKGIYSLTVALSAMSVAKIKDLALTAQIMALYAKDAIIKGVNTARTLAGVAATVAQTTATVAWTAVCTAATAVTTAFGAAMAFLTSPIGLAVAAIAAVIAIGVLLYKNWDTVMEYARHLGATISGIWTTIQTGCAAMCNSITGLFTSAFSALPGILKAPVNAVISLINGAINAINGIGFTVPDWVPGMGGQSFSANLPNIPMLAKGGFTSGPSIAGEAGTEAVISFDPAYRRENLGYLAQAAAMLGVGSGSELSGYAAKLDSLSDVGSLASGGTVISYNMGGITFAPTVTVAGGTEEKGNIIEQLRNYEGDLLDMIEDLLDRKERGGYGASGVF